LHNMATSDIISKKNKAYIKDVLSGEMKREILEAIS
jgi:hypothetical protein